MNRRDYSREAEVLGAAAGSSQFGIPFSRFLYQGLIGTNISGIYMMSPLKELGQQISRCNSMAWAASPSFQG